MAAYWVVFKDGMHPVIVYTILPRIEDLMESRIQRLRRKIALPYNTGLNTILGCINSLERLIIRLRTVASGYGRHCVSVRVRATSVI
jgi:hypothetical protein